MEPKTEQYSTQVSVRTILIVDDHAVFRDGLQRLISTEPGLEVCAQAADGNEALQKAAQLNPDLVIIDVVMDGMNGIDLTKALRARYPKMKLLVLSMHKEILYAERALRAGANGYIMKRENGEMLIAAIRSVLGGETYVSREFNAHLLARLSGPKGDPSAPTTDRLTDREIEIFRLIGQGYGTKQIASELHLSMKTVIFHRTNIRTKLNMKSTFELVQFAIHNDESNPT
jgi:DNA-binding NarL/FixJ family response regulator